MSSTAQPTDMRADAVRTGGLYDVVELILDRGLVIDVFVRVSLVGIELLTVDARIVVASVDTYLRFAEACNRLDLNASSSSTTLPELVGDVTEKGARGKAKGALTGAAETFTEQFQKAQEDREDRQDRRDRQDRQDRRDRQEDREQTESRSRRRRSDREDSR